MSDDVKAAVQGLLRGEPSAQAVAHLLKGCPSCTQVLASAMGPRDHPDLSRVVNSLQRCAATASARAALERDLAPALVDNLLELPQGRRITVVRNSWQYQSPPIVVALSRHSRQNLGRDPEEARHLAELGKEAADRLSVEVYGLALVMDTMGRSRVALAIALRQVSRYQEAASCLNEAEELLLSGSGDPVDQARLLEERGELYSRQKRIGLSRQSLQRAAKLYLAQDDFTNVGKVLARLARTWCEAEEPHRDSRTLSRALELMDPREDGRLAFAVAHNLLESLLETGQTGRALALMPIALKAYELFARPSDHVLLQWTEARLLASVDRLEDATSAFEVTRDRYLALGMPIEAALCALDGALVNLQLGRLDEVKKTASEIVPTFKSRQLGREALAALSLFKRAAEEEVATAQTIRAVGRALRARLTTPRQ